MFFLAEKGKKPDKQVDIKKLKIGYLEDLHKIKIALIFLFAINVVHGFSFIILYLFPTSTPPLQELLVVLYILIVFDVSCLIPYFVLYYKYKKL